MCSCFVLKGFVLMSMQFSCAEDYEAYDETTSYISLSHKHTQNSFYAFHSKIALLLTHLFYVSHLREEIVRLWNNMREQMMTDFSFLGEPSL